MTITLTTTGRTTGRPRPVTLYGFADGDRIVVVGSRGGAVRPKDPDSTRTIIRAISPPVVDGNRLRQHG